MLPLIQAEDDQDSSKLPHLVLSFSMHTLVALGSWLALMLAGYLVNPPAVSQNVILILSMLVPLVAGYFVTHIRKDKTATFVWLVGLIWALAISLWIVDLPTGPNTCFRCDATDKLTRSLFSLPQPSGLIDNDGPFLGTWPAAALIGYALGAQLALSRRAQSSK